MDLREKLKSESSAEKINGDAEDVNINFDKKKLLVIFLLCIIMLTLLYPTDQLVNSTYLNTESCKKKKEMGKDQYNNAGLLNGQKLSDELLEDKKYVIYPDRVFFAF
jgi:hypothetical protein